MRKKKSPQVQCDYHELNKHGIMTTFFFDSQFE